MNDAAKLAAYIVIVVVTGALLAAPLFWGAQTLLAMGIGPDLTRYGFRSFFHRGLLIAALAFLWPLVRSLRINGWRDLGLRPNPGWRKELGAGVVLAALPLAVVAAGLVMAGIYEVRSAPRWGGLWQVALAAVFVPLIEETFFRGFLLGVLQRSGHILFALLLSSGLYSIVHYLKAPDRAVSHVDWNSGFGLLGEAFHSFQAEPLPTIAACVTLFVLGLIMGDARLRTRSLWLPVGLHAGWVFANGAFTKIARHEIDFLPWIGRNLLVGFIPILVVSLTWLLLRFWLASRDETAARAD